MPIIAFKNNIVSWDSQITSGAMSSGLQTRKVIPVSTFSGMFVGGYGSMGEVQRFQRWINRMDRESLSEWLMDPSYLFKSVNTLMFVWNGANRHMTEVYRNNNAPASFILPKEGYALGTGDDYAMGCMIMGAPADKAVELVCRRFDGCSGPINKAVASKPTAKQKNNAAYL